MKLRTAISLFATVSWLCAAVWWTFYQQSGAWAVPLMEPNAWGDWAAGVFAPLAFLWLVVGYFQQGEELRDNVRALNLQEEALRLQVQELRESVQQQTAMATAAAKQADMLDKSHEIALRSQVLIHQPRFSKFALHVRNPETGFLTFKADNIGAPCYDVDVLPVEPVPGETDQPHPLPFSDWGTNVRETLAIRVGKLERPHVDVEINYTDELLVRQRQVYRLALLSPLTPGNRLPSELLHMTFGLPNRGELV